MFFSRLVIMIEIALEIVEHTFVFYNRLKQSLLSLILIAHLIESVEISRFYGFYIFMSHNRKRYLIDRKMEKPLNIKRLLA